MISNYKLFESVDNKINHIECNIIPPNSKDKYFFIVILNINGDSISFDNTIKGHRILKQVNIGKYTGNKSIRESWFMYVFKDGKYKGEKWEDWIDEGKDDIINGIVYRQVWEIPTPRDIDNMLLTLNNFLWLHKDDLQSKEVTNKMKQSSKYLLNISKILDMKNDKQL